MSQRRLETLFAPGKLFLFGEWAVLEGAEALVVEAPGGQRGQLTLTPRVGASAPRFSYAAPELLERPRDWVWRDARWCQKEVEEADLDLVGETLSEAAKSYGEPLFDLSLRVETESLFHTKADGERVKLGFGSSGSVCALVSCALARACGVEGLEAQLQVALRGHRNAQRGRGSGADVAASLYRGIIRYQLDEAPGLEAWAIPELSPKVHRVAGRDDLSLFAVWTGRAADTRALMKAMRLFEARSRRAYLDAILGVGQAAAEGVEAWQTADLNTLFTCVRQAEMTLRDLGSAAGVEIVTVEHDAIATSVKQVLGERAAVKPSGAGGGDMTLLFVDKRLDDSDTEAMASLFATLEALGCVILRVPVLLG